MADFGNRFDDAAGKAKEGAGKVAGDEDLEREGKLDQAKADAKDAAERAKDKASEAADKVKGAFKKK